MIGALDGVHYKKYLHICLLHQYWHISPKIFGICDEQRSHIVQMCICLEVWSSGDIILVVIAHVCFGCQLPSKLLCCIGDGHQSDYNWLCNLPCTKCVVLVTFLKTITFLLLYRSTILSIERYGNISLKRTTSALMGVFRQISQIELASSIRDQ